MREQRQVVYSDSPVKAVPDLIGGNGKANSLVLVSEQTLRSTEVPLRVECGLTALWKTLVPGLKAMKAWGGETHGVPKPKDTNAGEDSLSGRRSE